MLKVKHNESHAFTSAVSVREGIYTIEIYNKGMRLASKRLPFHYLPKRQSKADV